MKKTRVMVVDDQFVARQLFELYLKSSERYELVHMVESAAFAETFMKSDAVDLVLMDILMNDDSNGLDAAVSSGKDHRHHLYGRVILAQTRTRDRH